MSSLASARKDGRRPPRPILARESLRKLVVRRGGKKPAEVEVHDVAIRVVRSGLFSRVVLVAQEHAPAHRIGEFLVDVAALDDQGRHPLAHRFLLRSHLLAARPEHGTLLVAERLLDGVQVRRPEVLDAKEQAQRGGNLVVARHDGQAARQDRDEHVVRGLHALARDANGGVRRAPRQLAFLVVFVTRP